MKSKKPAKAYVPRTLEEKEDALRLGAQLLQKLREMAQTESSAQPPKPTKRRGKGDR